MQRNDDQIKNTTIAFSVTTGFQNEAVARPLHRKKEIE
jgi:hypothetical protein